MIPKIMTRLYGFTKVIAIAANKNPKEYAPESPINTFAGGRLYAKNAAIEANIIRQMLIIRTFEEIKNPIRDIKTKLPAKPSIPSW